MRRDNLEDYIIINLENDDEDEFDLEGKNVAQVKVFNTKGEDITSNCRVIFELSEEALIGLGTELIRLSKRFEDGKHIHLVPSDKQFISQSMGIFLTSKSCEMIIGCTEFGKIEDHLDD
jgi:hypothetical protein